MMLLCGVIPKGMIDSRWWQKVWSYLGIISWSPVEIGTGKYTNMQSRRKFESCSHLFRSSFMYHSTQAALDNLL